MIDLPVVPPSAAPPQHVAYWPYCEACRQPFAFDQEGPFAHCRCGTTEWGNPRPFDWVPDPAKAALPEGWKAMPPQLTDEQLEAAMGAHEGRMYQADMHYGPRGMRQAEYAAVFAAAPAPPAVDTTPLIDLDAIAWEDIKAAAAIGYRTWMPPEYTANDWQADIIQYLKTGSPTFLQPDASEIDRLRSELDWAVLQANAGPRTTELLRDLHAYLGSSTPAAPIAHVRSGAAGIEIEWLAPTYDGYLFAAAPPTPAPIADRHELHDLAVFLRTHCTIKMLVGDAGRDVEADKLRRAAQLLLQVMDAPELIATVVATAERWERIADQHGVRQFTGNDHRLMANELRASVAGCMRSMDPARARLMPNVSSQVERPAHVIRLSPPGAG